LSKLVVRLKRAVKRILPHPILNLRYRLRDPQSLLLDFLYDYRTYRSFSSVRKRFETQPKLRAKIVIGYHKIEKGLSLREPRPGFGVAAVNQLVADLSIYKNRYGSDETVRIALDALMAYYAFNCAAGVHDQILEKKIAGLLENTPDSQEYESCMGGVFEVSRDELLSDANLDLTLFFQSRHSIRHFSTEEVDLTLIERAVSMAQYTPSVCNRQPWKIYAFTDADDNQRILSLQNGNRGFGDQARVILIITSPLDHFVSMGERNQPWIDGGMFAMSVVYALHSLGLGTCCLNWSVRPPKDKQLKAVANIPQSEVVIMLIAVGHLPAHLSVARSARKHLDEVLIIK